MFCDKAFNIAKNPKYDKQQRGLTSGDHIKYQIMLEQQLAEELCKAIIRKLKINKVNSSFKNNTWG